LAVGKEIYGECFFLCRELFVWLSANKPLCRVFLARVFSVPRAFCLALGKEAFVPSVFSMPGVFYFALGKAFFAESFLFSPPHRNELWAKPRIPVVIGRRLVEHAPFAVTCAVH
jgi:hypothetical protein